ncbi:MAG: hypothetical protein M1119_01605 [Firmicutes bacterium]|nr:hypothetical protein [Bacillota bacterium]
MGSRPITAILNREGFSISRPTVQKYLREMNISNQARAEPQPPEPRA